jgi:dual specificity phosphatase 12
MSMITEKLYVAGAEETYQDCDLKGRVTHFLNVASEVMINTRVDHGYKKIGINDDDLNCDIRSILIDAVSWIDGIIENDKGVVCVHCLEGKSRSICICIAYLCLKLDWDFHEAVKWVKHQRPEMDIFPLYYDQLRMYILGC